MPPAQVRSTDAIEQFRTQLAKFEQQVRNALETLAAEVQRAADWLESNRPRYWKEQTKQAEDRVHQAKLDLERCLIFPIAGEQPTCREEKSVLKQAKARVEYCREKCERVRHWTRQMHHEMYEHQARLGQLRQILETELPAARARLLQIVRNLDAYQIEQTPHFAEQQPMEQQPLELQAMEQQPRQRQPPASPTETSSSDTSPINGN